MLTISKISLFCCHGILLQSPMKKDGNGMRLKRLISGRILKGTNRILSAVGGCLMNLKLGWLVRIPAFFY